MAIKKDPYGSFFMGYIYSLLMLGSWLVPLHILPWVGWQQEVMAFAAVLGLGWHTLLVSHASGRLAIPQATILLGAVATIIGIQWWTQHITFGGDALVLGFYLALIAVCWYVGYALSVKLKTTPTALDGFALTVLVGAIFSVVITLAQVFEVWEFVPLINRTESIRRPGANLGQPNHLATLLLMGIASLAYLYESKKLSAILASSLFALLIIGLALTESRTGLLSFFLMAFWWLVRRRSVGFKASAWAVLLGGASLIFLLWAWPPFLAFVQSGGDMTGRFAERINLSAGMRLVVWPQLWGAVLQHPWFGWGLREVSQAHNAVLHSYTQAEPFSYAHNILLDLAVGVGLPLTVLLGSVLAVWGWRRTRDAKTLLPWYCIAVILPLAVHSLLEFPFAYSYLLVPAMLAIGVLEGVLAPTRMLKVAWWPAAIVLSLAMLLMIWSAVEYVWLEEDFRIARFEAVRIGETPVNYERPKIVLLSQLDALMAGARLVPMPGMNAERIELARKVALRYPWTATQNRYALTLALNGNEAEAVRQLKVMRAMHGERSYAQIKLNWENLGQTKYPQLRALQLP